MTFANFRIVEARDVGGFAPEYFEEQLRPEVVEQNVYEHR